MIYGLNGNGKKNQTKNKEKKRKGSMKGRKLVLCCEYVLCVWCCVVVNCVVACVMVFRWCGNLGVDLCRCNFGGTYVCDFLHK